MDTTAKVDIRKLQLLNDRIAQTIDALNQVRLSVHGVGLSHTGAVPGFGAVPFQSMAYQTPYGAPSPYAAAAPYAAAVPAIAQQFGLSHTTPYAFSQPFAAAAANPVVQQLLWQQGLAGGLSHSSDWGSSAWGGSPYQHAIDPISATRIMQLFPFAQMPISPVAGVY